MAGKAKEANKKFSFVGMLKSIGAFFKNIVGEIKRITWPNWNKTVKNTVIVIACCLVIGVFVWVFDFGFDKLVNYLIGLASK